MVPTIIKTQLKDIVQRVRHCKSAQEERKFVERECAKLRKSFNTKSGHEKCIALTKLLYFYILGYPAHFGQMECLALISSNRFVDKRIGYMGCTMLLDESADVHLMVTNSIQNDLTNGSAPVRSLALSTLANICSSDMARALAQSVKMLLTDDACVIAKKAALCAHRMISKAPELADMFLPCIKSLLNSCDLGSQLCGCTLAITMCEIDGLYVEKIKDLEALEITCKSLRNVAEYGVSPEHKVHGVSNPFLQIKILRLMSYLCKNDQEASNSITNLLSQLVTHVKTNKLASAAILYEVCLTIFKIDCSVDLVELAMHVLSSFLQSNNQNYKYVSLSMMSKIIATNPIMVQRYRNDIFCCINDSNKTIVKRSIELIFHTINGKNVVDSIERLTQYLFVCDPSLKDYISSNIIRSIEKYSKNKQWNINVFIDLLATASGHVQNDSFPYFISLISDCPEIRKDIVFKLFNFLQNNKSDPILINVACWVVGEYGNEIFLNPESGCQLNLDEVICVLINILHSNETSTLTKCFSLTALMKLASKLPNIEPDVTKAIKTFEACLEPEIQQRCIEWIYMSRKNTNFRQIIFESIPPFSVRSNLILSSDLTYGKTTSNIPSPPIKELQNNPLLDLIGIFSTSINDKNDNTPDISPIEEPNIPLHHKHKYDFYNKNGIVIYFTFDDPLPNGLLNLYLFANNCTNKPLKNFKCLISTPTSLSSTLQPPTTTSLLPNNANTLSQLIIITNPQKVNIKLRLKISYEIDAIKTEEILSIFDFPKFNYSPENKTNN